MKRILFLIACLYLSLAAPASEVDSVALIHFKKIVDSPQKHLNIFNYYIDSLNNLPVLSREQQVNLARLYTNASLACYYLGKHDQAVSTRLSSIRLYEELNDPASYAHQYCELGHMMKRRDLETAFRYMRKGLALLEKTDRHQYAGDLNNFGVLFLLRGDLDSAIYHYQLSFDIKKEFDDSLGMAYSLNNIFEALLMQNKTGEALKILDQSTLIRQNIKDGLGLTENYWFYGDYYRKLEQYPKAISYYLLALDRCLKHPYPLLAEICAKQLSECYEHQNNPVKALYYYKLHTQFKDSIQNEEARKTVAELEVKFETGEKEKEIALHKSEVGRLNLEARQRNYMVWGSVSFALFVCFIFYLVYRQQKFRQQKLKEENLLKDKLAAATLTNKLQEQRLYISRDLHDNIGAQLTFVISSLDNLVLKIGATDEKIKERIRSINAFTRETITELRDTIWAMNKESISVDELESRLSSFISKASDLSAGHIELHFEKTTNTKLNSIQGINIYRAIQEALNNAIKHAAAKTVHIHIHETGPALFVTVSDNGKGFDTTQAEKGNGLHNMKKRMDEISGTVELRSTPGKGTEIRFSIPLTDT